MIKTKLFAFLLGIAILFVAGQISYAAITVRVELKASDNSPINGAVVYYAEGSWKPFGSTGDTGPGYVEKSFPDGTTNLKVRLTYAGASLIKIQDVSVNPTITFQTVNTLVTLKDCAGNGLTGGTIQYAKGTWLSFGTTDSNGEARKELLPTSYKFRMTYNYKSQTITQSNSSPVAFVTAKVSSFYPGTIEYAGGSWRTFTSPMQMLPGTYTFRYGPPLSYSETFDIHACDDIWVPLGYVPVELSQFSASPSADGGIKLEWATGSETENLGFYLYRSTKIDGEYSRITETLIPGAGNSAEGHSYSYVDQDVETAAVYYYKLADVDFSGVITFHGPVAATPASAPMAYELAQNFPNPFNPSTSISFSLPDAGYVHLAIYDLGGRLVRTLVAKDLSAGNHLVTWDGKNENGRKVASSMYLYRLQAGNVILQKKLVLQK